VLELDQHKRLGKLYGLYDGLLGTNPTLVCGHPEVLKQITIKHFDSFTNRRRPATWKAIRYRALTYMRDDEWKNLRKILAPTFTSNKLKKMFELMKRCTKNLEMSINYQRDSEIDLKKLFSVFTVDVISTCCFSMDLKDYRHPDSEILISARKFFNVSRLKMAFAMAIPKQLLAWSGFDINDTTSIEFFARFAQEIINKRRQLSSQQKLQYKKQDDFLQTLIDAAAEFNERKPATMTTNERQKGAAENAGGDGEERGSEQDVAPIGDNNNTPVNHLEHKQVSTHKSAQQQQLAAPAGGNRQRAARESLNTAT
jgi:cytochrome P450